MQRRDPEPEPAPGPGFRQMALLLAVGWALTNIAYAIYDLPLKFVLKEELHVRKVTTEERHPETVTVRQEQVAVERVDRAPERVTPEPTR